MYSVHNEYPTNLSYYCSFRDKSLGNYFIASELKVSAKSQNKVQTYYAKVLWYSLQPWKGILLFISPVKAKLLFKYSKICSRYSVSCSPYTVCGSLTGGWGHLWIAFFCTSLINRPAQISFGGGLHCCTGCPYPWRAGASLVVAHGLLIGLASLVSECGLCGHVSSSSSSSGL